MSGALAIVSQPCRPLEARAVALVARSTRGGLCDLLALIRDTLAALRENANPVERALFLVRLLPALPGEARGQLALALVTSLRAQELSGIARAGLLALDEACAPLDPPWAETARALLAPALAARPRPVEVAGTLLCAEGVSPRVSAWARSKLQARGPNFDSVVVIASAASMPASAEEAADLLAAEARLTGDSTLAQLAALRRVEVISETSLAPEPSRWRRALAALVAAAKAQWSGEEPEPTRRPAWSPAAT